MLTPTPKNPTSGSLVFIPSKLTNQSAGFGHVLAKPVLESSKGENLIQPVLSLTKLYVAQRKNSCDIFTRLKEKRLYFMKELQHFIF